mgnify:CR=1 FL=1
MLKKIIQNLMRKSIILSNTVPDGIHGEGRVTYTAAAAISTKFLFGKQTANVGEIALSGSSNTSTGARAVGVICDEADAAGDHVSVSLMGATGSTMKVLAGGTFAVGDLVTANASSQAVTFASQPTSATYYIYGIAITPAVSGERVEFIPTPGVTATK